MLRIELLLVVDTARLLVTAPPFLNKQPVASLIMIRPNGKILLLRWQMAHIVESTPAKLAVTMAIFANAVVIG